MIDLHCHLDLYDDPDDVVREVEALGMYVLSVTNAPAAWEGTARLARSCPRIRTAVGIHPELAHTVHADLDLFRSCLPRTRYVGEVGLDGGPNVAAYQRQQKTVFNGVLAACSESGGKILSIHSRRAVPEVLGSLRAEPDAGVAVLHWFSGSKRELDAACELGCWFSIGPSMVASEKGLALIAEMPAERVLPETDGPFVRIDNRAARPSDIDVVLSALGSVWGRATADVVSQCRANLLDLIGRIALP